MKLTTGCLTFVLAISLMSSKTLANDEDNETNSASSTTTVATSSSSTTARTTTKPSTTSSTTVSPTPSKPTQKPVKSECPTNCDCLDTSILCKDRKQKTLPNLTKFINVSKISFKNTSLEQLDFSLLPASIDRLDLSGNNISQVVSTKANLTKLKSINLSENQLKNLTSFIPYKVNLPAIEEIDLSLNPIEEIMSPSTFNNTKSLKTLLLNQTRLKSVGELIFAPLLELHYLDLSDNRLTSHLGLKQFATNTNLSTLVLANNSMVEVPIALRSISSIETLILDKNLFTSLRRSDFINQSSIFELHINECPLLTRIDEYAFSELSSLHVLILTNNPKLSSISKDAFKSDSARLLREADLSGNNFTTLFDPINGFTSMTLPTFTSLKGNQWHCNCDLQWFEKLTTRDLVHCKSPDLYKDMTVGFFLSTVDCEQEKSSYHKIILTSFLLFLVGLTIAVFVQKSEICRRIFWKDQYGTIYYTKASFQPEST